MNIPIKFEVRSFTRSEENANRGYPKNWAVPGYAHTHFLQNFNGFLFRLALKIYPPNFKSVALPVPEIRGVATS